MVDEFSSKYPNPDMWTGNEKDTPYLALKEHLVRYQNPEEADSIQKIYKELDETKDILVRGSLQPLPTITGRPCCACYRRLPPLLAPASTAMPVPCSRCCCVGICVCVWLCAVVWCTRHLRNVHAAHLIEDMFMRVRETNTILCRSFVHPHPMSQPARSTRTWTLC